MQRLIFIIIGFILISCNEYKAKKVTRDLEINFTSMDTITLGAGCFWCVEAIFQDIKGVQSVLSGYAGGAIKKKY